MNISKFAALSLALAGSMAAGLAQARTDVQWAVSVAGPIGVAAYGQTHSAPAYTRPVVVPAPVFVQTGYSSGRRHDRDGDGIPNRYDKRYNPRWDRDGDGIPNRYDTRYNPHGGDRRGHDGPSWGDSRGHDQGGRGHEYQGGGRGHDQYQGGGRGRGQDQAGGEGGNQGSGQGGGRGQGRGPGRGDTGP